eukprot:1112650-Rhodomonas_salina.4
MGDERGRERELGERVERQEGEREGERESSTDSPRWLAPAARNHSPRRRSPVCTRKVSTAHRIESALSQHAVVGFAVWVLGSRVQSLGARFYGSESGV